MTVSTIISTISGRPMMRPRRPGLPFGCARNSLAFLFCYYYIDDDHDVVGCIGAALALYVLGVLWDDYIRHASWRCRGGRSRRAYGCVRCPFPPLPCSPLDIFHLLAVSSRIGKGRTLRCLLRCVWYGTAGHFGLGTFPHAHNIILPRYAGRHTWYEYFPPVHFFAFSHRDLGPRLCTCAHV